MKQQTRKKILLVGLVLVGILFTSSIGFIAIQNVDPAPVITGTISVSAYEVNLEQSKTWSWDIGELVNPEFDSATVKGIMAFSVTMTGDPVDVVKLTVDGVSSGASPGGIFIFTEGTNGQWTLAFDTTVLLDGEYLFTLSYLIVDADGGGGGGSDVPMSAFGFFVDDNEVVIDIDGSNILWMIAAGILVIIVVRRYRKK